MSWPAKLFVFDGMLSEQKIVHRPGSGVPTLAKIATAYVPFGNVVPNSTSELWLRIFTGKPA